MNMKLNTPTQQMPDFSRLDNVVKKRTPISFESTKIYMERTLARTSRANVSIHVPTRHNSKMQFAESYNELSFIQKMEINPDVEYLEMQPFSIRYELGGRYCRYTPDALVSFSTSSFPVLYEIKHVAAYSKQDEIKFTYHKSLFAKARLKLKLILSDEIGCFLERENSAMLIRHLWHKADLNTVRRFWAMSPSLASFGQYVAIADEVGSNSNLVAKLLAHRFLHVDMKKRISCDSLMSKFSQEKESAYGYAA